MTSFLTLRRSGFWPRCKSRFGAVCYLFQFHFGVRTWFSIMSFCFWASSVSSSAAPLFGVAVFRHLPELDRSVDILLFIKRGVIFGGCLFALFCTSLEVERLGQAFEGDKVRK